MGQKKRMLTKKLFFYIGNTLFALLFISPLIWMVMASLKPESQIFANMDSLKTFIPTGASLNNYVSVFTRIDMLRFICNSFFYILIILLFDLIFNSMCGYALAKFDFAGKQIILTLVIALMAIPMEAIILPLYKEVADIGWINHWEGLIVPFIAKAFSIYMFRQFFLDIPNDLLEAAAIDGYGSARIFFFVVMPISGTVYATVFILDFVAHWNDFMWPLMAITGDAKKTVQLAIQTFFGMKPINYGQIMAALTIATIPMLIIFVLLQKYYVKGIASTGIKG